MLSGLRETSCMKPISFLFLHRRILLQFFCYRRVQRYFGWLKKTSYFPSMNEYLPSGELLLRRVWWAVQAVHSESCFSLSFFSVKFELEYVIVGNPTSTIKSLFHFGVCNQLHYQSIILIWRMSLEWLSEWVSSKQIFSIVSQTCLILMLRSLKSNGFHRQLEASDSNSSLTWEFCRGRRNIEHLCKMDLISFDEWLMRK